MALIWYEYALIAAIFSGILVLFAGMTFSFARVRMQKWVGGAIGNFMNSLAQQAAEEEGAEGSITSSTSGQINLGGFKIDVKTIKELLPLVPQILEVAKMFGITGGGGGGSGTANPFLKP